MSIHHDDKVETTRHSEVPAPRVDADFISPAAVSTTAAGKTLAALRITMGLLFLWAFADKAFGLGYATSTAKSWFNGGSPTKGFLSSVDAGPFTGMLHSWAGTWWADSLFMIGLLAIGVALLLGVALRITAVAGTLMMAFMWIAEWPLARFNDAGKATSSTNPIIDYHFVFAVVLIVLAAFAAGNTWGFGRKWAELTGNRSWLR